MGHTSASLQPNRSLQLRAGDYYFRQRLPRDVASSLDQREIVRSLNTSHYATALARKRRVEAALQRAIDLLIETNPTDVATARALFRRWFENRLNQDFRQRQSTSCIKRVAEPYPSSPLEEMAWTADQRLMLTRAQSEARFIAKLLIERAGGSADFKHLANLIEHALHELSTRIIPRRDAGDFADEINDRLVKEAFEDVSQAAVSSPTQTPEPVASGPSLTEAIERFLAEQRPAVSQKTLLDYDQTFRLAQDFWGAGIPVGAIKKAAAREFKDLLLPRDVISACRSSRPLGRLEFRIRR